MELGSRQEGDESFLFGRNLSGTLEKLNKSVKNLVIYVAELEKKHISDFCINHNHIYKFMA